MKMDMEAGDGDRAVGVFDRRLGNSSPVPTHTMESQAYPGKGLSLSQLVFALNAELDSMTYSPL